MSTRFQAKVPQITVLEPIRTHKLEWKRVDDWKKDIPTFSECYLEFKEGDDISEWQRCFVCLFEDKIMIFKDRNARLKKLVYAFIRMGDVETLKLVTDEDQYCICLKNIDFDWMIRGFDDDQTLNWFGWLNAALGNGGSNPRWKQRTLSKKRAKEMFLEGVLDKQVRGGLSWTKCHCVLQNGSLFIYKLKNIDKPPRRIPLANCQLEEYKPTSETCRSFSITTFTGNKITFRTSSEVEMHDWLNKILKHKIYLDDVAKNIPLSNSPILSPRRISRGSLSRHASLPQFVRNKLIKV